MTEQTQITEEEVVENLNAGQEELAEDVAPVDELAMLKQRAKLMGIAFSNNIGVAKLKALIEAKQNDEAAPTSEGVPSDEDGDDTPVNPLELGEPVKPKLTLRQQLLLDAMKLVRLRITNLDPKKKDLPGEIITVANEYIGTVKKYVPFGEVTEDGYHVPYVIYEILKNRKFLNIRTITNKQNPAQVRVDQKWVPEFALEVLPSLTPEELAKLATAQLAAGGVTS